MPCPRSAFYAGSCKQKQTVQNCLHTRLLDAKGYTHIRYRVIIRGRLKTKEICQTLGVATCYISADKHKTLIFMGLVQTRLKYEVLPPPATIYTDTPEMMNSYINRVINQEERDGRGMWHVWGTGEAHIRFW